MVRSLKTAQIRVKIGHMMFAVPVRHVPVTFLTNFNSLGRSYRTPVPVGRHIERTIARRGGWTNIVHSFLLSTSEPTSSLRTCHKDTKRQCSTLLLLSNHLRVECFPWLTFSRQSLSEIQLCIRPGRRLGMDRLILFCSVCLVFPCFSCSAHNRG